MKTLTIMMLCGGLLLGAFACDSQQKEPGTAPTKTEAPVPAEPAPADDESKTKPAEDQSIVEVAAAGTKFDPPVKPEQMPEGAWYCAMGTVHWAGMEKPEDGKCPVCGMKLKLKE